jgi:hypothetical protein
MGGIREFNCACFIVNLVLALLLNTSRSYTLLRIICLVSTVETIEKTVVIEGSKLYLLMLCLCQLTKRREETEL